ncbi:MAG: aminodeoxychorismate/anthranilate synthase component II, partial [Thalassospira sp.]|nr:aminodeoxychorismate/anthranilate synthase component II [Thalassospira sp.]
MYLLLDNYDSFTYNLLHYLQVLGADVDVVRNDALTVDEALQRGYQGIILSPGPCTPTDAGISLPLITAAIDAKLPLLGVCLGHQAL